MLDIFLEIILAKHDRVSKTSSNSLSMCAERNMIFLQQQIYIYILKFTEIYLLQIAILKLIFFDRIPLYFATHAFPNFTFFLFI